LNPRAFLVSYRPLCRTRFGQKTVSEYGINPYVDGSCRREPDLEAVLPLITCLCRGGLFAPRLSIGDRVAYITKKGAYDDAVPHWRLTALLQVKERFETHQAAADWYRHEGLPVPRNCIVEGVEPLPLHLTDGEIPLSIKRHRDRLRPEQIIRLWDSQYAERARKHPVALACLRLRTNLADPPKILESDWREWCGRVPVTRNPPQIDEKTWTSLEARMRMSDGG